MESNKSEVQTCSINNTQSVELINDQLIKDVQNKKQQVCIIQLLYYRYYKNKNSKYKYV